MGKDEVTDNSLRGRYISSMKSGSKTGSEELDG